MAGAESHEPQVIVSDIRMPPNFQREGIDACKEIRKRHPGTGVVILSQYDDPDYAISLLSEGAAGYAYLLKDRIAEGDQLARAIREVATGGSMLDPAIVERARAARCRARTSCPRTTRTCCRWSPRASRSRPSPPPARRRRPRWPTTSSASSSTWPRACPTATTGPCAASAGCTRPSSSARSRARPSAASCPAAWPSALLRGGTDLGETERLEVTVLMSDIRGYSTIAERADPAALALQLNRHRGEMNRAILAEGGTVMQYVGDAVMAVFGAPTPSEDHADRSLAAALAMHAAQAAINEEWSLTGQPAFGLGIGLSTGEVAAALLGSEERLEYTVVGDAVNLAQRLQQLGAARADGRQRGHVGQPHVQPVAAPSGSTRSSSRGATTPSPRIGSVPLPVGLV